ncbi:hypothetical protein C7964_1012 [Loktanella sp. PT4BL]|jgi:hypothetical protein|uniref:hypothetical protein n=1 Tax=Loktanella sp. PT4BL TaxID=2135611 RepID=UPI000D75690B|nr:hypothetical protein [Loktanella sp. PT4BL]PXW71897.1 hypothetical protein C7964_1012 [Loktanella sp. PT4BL]
MQNDLPHSWMLDVLSDLKAYTSKKGLHVCEDALDDAYNQIMTNLLSERLIDRKLSSMDYDGDDEKRRVIIFNSAYKGILF